jgi:hypothetical protein
VITGGIKARALVLAEYNQFCHPAQRYAAIQCSKHHPPRRRVVPRLRFDQDDVRFELRGVRCGLPNLHVSHLSSGDVGVPGTLARACKPTVPGCSMRTVCLSASVPALGRTRHPFAVSGSEGPSPKIEFVFSASPETIRREPRECDLLRSVGNMQDLAVCAFCSSCFFRQYFMLP